MQNVLICFVYFYCLTAYLFASNSLVEDSKITQKQALIKAINAITSIQTIPINTKEANIKKDTIKCVLTRHEKDSIKLVYPNTFYEYYNALLEINRTDMDISKLTQDLLIESMRYNNTPSLLLAMQLYFSKKCDRCERVRDFSVFDYYRDKRGYMRNLLMSEGGSFESSYALLGEGFLCKALKTKNENDFLMAYSNLMMAGLHTRAINILLKGLESTNSDILYSTLQFLTSFDNVVAKHEITTYFLRMLRISEKYSFTNIITLPYFKDLQVLEYGIESNAILQTLLTRDMEIGRILSVFDMFGTEKTKKEFWDKETYYSKLIHEGNMYILQNATVKELKAYLKILKLKKRIKEVNSYPFATTYR